MVIKKGGGTHSIDFNTYKVQNNQIFFLRPGQMHKFSPDKDTEFYFIAIDQETIQLNSTILLSQFSFFSALYAHKSIIIDNIEPIIKLIKSIQEALSPDNKYKLNQNIILPLAKIMFSAEGITTS